LALLLIAVALAAGLGPVLWLGVGQGLEAGGLADPYLLRVVRFTLLQAGLSTLLSLLFAIPVARALAAVDFPGRGLVLKLFALPLALPAIVAILGIVSVFGARGWLPLDLYGLTGILVAHVFFNMPLAVRFLLQRLEAIPLDSWRLAEQLGLSAWQRFKLIEAPAMGGALPGTASLIFLLCAASFAVVLTLGGGPQATTLEVAIYQSLRFDYDPARAAILALAQLLLCAVLAALAAQFGGALQMWPGQSLRRVVAPRGSWADYAVIAIGTLFVALPIVAVAVSGLNAALQFDSVLTALRTSLMLGFCSAVICVTLAWPLAAAAHHARRRLARFAYGSGPLLALIVPPAVLATGWFLLLHDYPVGPALVVAMNALMALPFALSALVPALADMARRHDRLCAQLAISGWTRLRLIDLPMLRKPLGLGFGLAMVVSLGDLTAISLFGTENFTTLPSLIYRQMGNYRSSSAAATALVLTLVSLALITLADWWGGRDDQA
jgi:thiamine transport system permease protein